MAAGAVMMVVAMFMPVPTLINDNPPPMIDNFTFLQHHMQRYDVILIDPKLTAVAPMEWDYCSKAYFPEGIQFVTIPAGYRRVWYVTNEDYDQNVAALVAKDRFPRESVGPARLHFQLYEAPPDAEGILFENGLRFHGLDFVGTVMPGMVTYHLNETFRVRFWWSLDKPLDHDYSVGLYVLLVRAGAGQLAMQYDTPVYANQLQPGQMYTEDRELTVASTMQTATYPITMAVYDPTNNNRRLTAPGENSENLLTVNQFSVKEWTAVIPPTASP